VNAGWKRGWSLPREHYVDGAAFGADLAAVWLRSWLFAGHSCEVPRAGDFFVFDLADESLIVARSEDGRLRALHNVCRHRGSRILDAAFGSAPRFVCPYHQWTYGLDGSLRACGGIDRELDLDRSELALGPAPVVEAAGLVFVSIATSPPSFEPVCADLERELGAHDLVSAKVAARRNYIVKANWKLIWENNRECWHCHLGHPEYVRANYDAAAGTANVEAELQLRVSELVAKGLSVDHAGVGLAEFPSEGRWWAVNRTPTASGFVTESLDGRPVAPPMGTYEEHDVGTVRARVLPGFWCHASADHAVTTRILPIGPAETCVDVSWLVDVNAVEGRDYELEALLPFWELTSEQDWALCERNQRGIRSTAYVPGPYSPSRERNVIAFDEWYRAAIS